VLQWQRRRAFTVVSSWKPGAVEITLRHAAAVGLAIVVGRFAPVFLSVA